MSEQANGQVEDLSKDVITKTADGRELLTKPDGRVIDLSSNFPEALDELRKRGRKFIVRPELWRGQPLVYEIVGAEELDPLPDDPAFMERFFGRKPRPQTPADWFSPIPYDIAERIPKDLPDLLKLPGLVNLRNVSDWGYMREKFREIPRDRVRGIQKRFGSSPWEFVEDKPDVHFGLQNYEVVGHRYNFTRYLTEDQALALWMLLKWKNKDYSRRTETDPKDRGDVRVVQSSLEEIFEHVLLCLCPRSVRVAPVDIDVRVESEDWCDGGDPVKGRNLAKEKRCKALGLEYAKRIVAEAPKHGLGEPLVFVSNLSKGSLHVDFLGPEGVESVNFAHAWESVIVPFLEKLEIPLVDDHEDMDKEEGPAVMADDTLFHRDADTRGSLWRPCGAAKPRRNINDSIQRKLWLPELDPERPRMPFIGMPEPKPIDADLLREACRLTDEGENAQPPEDQDVEWDDCYDEA